ncbi:MarR family transcriptional regulator [Lentzea pudingi]|uniref:MarR family transcriptional regulator n=2 Tax=Lentzea pudingi TaxID=1789439 RepID=A0ABQ2I5K5_9PSEU|nr:MarR family transcriptional regulator [Lentzea pudingi]
MGAGVAKVCISGSCGSLFLMMEKLRCVSRFHQQLRCDENALHQFNALISLQRDVKLTQRTLQWGVDERYAPRMPGGRLTQQERRQIAIGLADGLAYAEIARSLDRPTSTITREVMRNGGPAGYKADIAQLTTERRAQRRKQATPRRQAVERADGRDPEAVREFEEVFSGIFVGQGLPKMTARALASLYATDSGSLTASELVGHLQVSPATVSKAMSYLEGQGLIGRVRDERRRERYVVDDGDIWYQSMIASAAGTTTLAEAARQGVSSLGPGTPAAVRLENIARFLDFVSESIVRAAEQARDILHSKR